MARKAKAWVFEAPGAGFVLKEFQLPELKEGEILVENICCTICKSDLHTFFGRRASPVPSILGHEIVGRVIKLPGPPVLYYDGSPVEVGDKITWALVVSCGNCMYCKNGYPQKCISLKKYGHREISGSHQLSGGFATHTHLLKGTSVFKLPENINNQVLAGLNCSWATAACVLKNAGNIAGKNILITGCGMLGLIATAMCRHYGAKTIICIDKNEERLKLSSYFGTDLPVKWDTCLSKTESRINKFIEGGQIDIIMEMSGSNDAINLGFSLAGIASGLVLAGSVSPVADIKINPENIVRKLTMVKGVHNYSPDDLNFAISFLNNTKHKFPFESLTGSHYSFYEINKALNEAETGNTPRVCIDTKNLQQ